MKPNGAMHNDETYHDGSGFYEWLETDGLGGFASGTFNQIRTRRYHALLLTATTPPTGRMVLVNGIEAWLETPAGNLPLTSQRYTPNVIYPDGSQRIEAFSVDPWPRWTLRIRDVLLEHGLFAVHGRALTVLYWRANGRIDGHLIVRPLISGRDYHSLHHENGAFNFQAEQVSDRVVFRPYNGVPSITFRTNGSYLPQPEWYRNFLYLCEQERGLDCVEDLASPGLFRFGLESDAFIVLSANDYDLGESFESMQEGERQRRAAFVSPRHRAADSYIVSRTRGKTIVAGYPWFTDWGRDTFISVRGLCLAGGRPNEAREIILEWSGHVSKGMLPNRFPDAGEQPEFNSVDASLWFIVAANELCQHPEADLDVEDRRRLDQAIVAILEGYASGTRYKIRADADGLLAAGIPGVQLTWMDAKVGDWVVTPRIGKPVEVEALWINALMIGARIDKKWGELCQRALISFQRRFWNERRKCLFDIVDLDHQPGKFDDSLRPNQIFAVGGLPFALLGGERGRAVVDIVEAHLLTPIGLRSLGPGEVGYRPRYQGGTKERDSAYHQGTVWPWLMGPFIEAWIRVRGNSKAAKAAARRQFLDPMGLRLDPTNSGHLPEIADGDEPHRARGCPFQAWSVAEFIRAGSLLG
jgi:predicted glycogen debranching enzyme